jgi:hypothetical protein
VLLLEDFFLERGPYYLLDWRLVKSQGLEIYKFKSIYILCQNLDVYISEISTVWSTSSLRNIKKSKAIPLTGRGGL